MTNKCTAQMNVLLHCIAMERAVGIPESALHEKYGVAVCNESDASGRCSGMPILDVSRLQVVEKLINKHKGKL